MLTCNFYYQRDDLRLDVEFEMNHKILGLVGDSGSGKSTILKLISGLLIPDYGHIRLNEQILYDDQQHINLAVHQRKIAQIFQKAWVFPHMNVMQNLMYAQKISQNPKPTFSFEQVVEVLDLKRLIKRKSYELSGGEAQRVSIARALLSSPDLLLLDEPLTGLDSTLKDQMLFFFSKVIQETQLPMIYVTHHEQELDYLNAEIHTLEQGKMR